MTTRAGARLLVLAFALAANSRAAAVSAPARASDPAAVAPTADAADAEVVLERTEVTITSDGGALEFGERTVRVRTEAGLAWAETSIPVYPLSEVSDVRGTLVLPGGKEVKLDPAHVVERPVLDDLAVARELRVIRASFPQTAPGSTVRVSWRRTLHALLFVPDWMFRGPLPIRRSVYTITVPEGFPLEYKAWNGDVQPVVTHAAAGVTYAFEARDVPALVEEPFSPPPHQRMGIVRFSIPQGATAAARGAPARESWESVGVFYDELAHDRYALAPELARSFRAEASRLRDPRAIVAAAYARLLEFRYVQVYLGMGGYQPHAAMWTWERRYGDCKDLATMFIAMLRAAGVEAWPMLTRLDPGYAFNAEFPSPKQFNHCIAVVPLKDGELVVDATAPTYPLGVLPAALGGAPALVVRDGRAAELRTLPATTAARHGADVELELTLGETGFLAGTFRSLLRGDHLARARLFQRRDPEEVVGGRVRYFLPWARSELKLTHLASTEAADALEVKGDVESALPPPRAGALALLSASLLVDDERVSAFAATERANAVDLGAPESTRVRIRLPAVHAARCPAPVEIDGPYGRYRLACAVDAERGLVLERALEVTRTAIAPAEYAAAREFWSAVGAADRRPVAMDMPAGAATPTAGSAPRARGKDGSAEARR